MGGSTICSSEKGTSRNCLSSSVPSLTELPWDRSHSQYTAPVWYTWNNAISICPNLCSVQYRSYQNPSHASTEMQTLLCRYQAWRKKTDRILNPKGKKLQLPVLSPPTFLSFGRSCLLKSKQTNNYLNISYSCGNAHLGTDRIQTRRGCGKTGVIPGLALTCQERARPSQALNRWLAKKIPGHRGSGVDERRFLPLTHQAMPHDDALVRNMKPLSFSFTTVPTFSVFILSRGLMGLS